MKTFIEKHPNPEYITIHTDMVLKDGGMIAAISHIPGVVEASISEIYKLKIKRGLCFEIVPIVDSIIEEIEAWHGKQQKCDEGQP